MDASTGEIIWNFVKPLFVVLPRIAALFVVFPMFAGEVVTGIVRNGILISLASVLYPLAAASIPSEPLSGFAWAYLIFKETFIGLVMGFVVSIFLWVVEGVGHLIDFQTGASNSTTFDPLTNTEAGPTSRFLVQLVITLFLTSGGFMTLLGVIFESYRVWPVFSFYPDMNASVESFFLHQTDSLMLLTVKLAAPIVMILVVAELGLGLVNRFAPHLNVFSLAMPIKGALAVLMLVTFLSFLYDSLRQFMAPDQALLRILRAII
jgi:type III secretion protein T